MIHFYLVFFTFFILPKLFGHKDVKILEGGFPEWKAAANPIEKDVESPREKEHKDFPPIEYYSNYQKDLLTQYEDIQKLLKDYEDKSSPLKFQLVDSRPSEM